MPNYKETEVVGSQYQRARLIQINNELNQTPFITFCEERVTVLPDKEFHEDVGQLTCSFDPVGEIVLINPETDEATGATISHAEFYAIVYSLYKQLAIERDAG